jgi:GNAT superfamily N-acetyltransferase
MLIKTLNPVDDPADLAALLPVFDTYYTEIAPSFPRFGRSRLRFWASAGPSSRAKVYAVFADEASTEALGAVFTASDLDANLDLVNNSLIVPLAGHCSGVAELLLDRVRELAVSEGRDRVLVETPSSADASVPLTALGGRKVHTSTRSVVDLAGIDRARYAAWAAPSEKNSDYQLVRWVDHCPDEFVESYCEAQRAMEDAPLEDLAFEHNKPSIERVRAQEEHSCGFGVRRMVQAAVDGHGRIAGLHMLVSYPDEPESLDVWDTCVVREHRGHGLGLRIKAAAALWALERRPGACCVQTFNNHENEHMLAVNRTLGYRAAEDWYVFEFSAAPRP